LDFSFTNNNPDAELQTTVIKMSSIFTANAGGTNTGAPAGYPIQLANGTWAAQSHGYFYADGTQTPLYMPAQGGPAITYWGVPP
jgi:hypothetical protein